MPGAADANVRAGFMLMPERGDSKLIYSATRDPAASPVYRASDAEPERVRITNISTAEIDSSATNAIQGPAVPGIVAAYWTGASVKADPTTAATRSTPMVPPTVCAAMKKTASQRWILPRRRKVRVTAGFICAPERFPHGEWIRAIAVKPIAMPARTLRSIGSDTAPSSGDRGEPSSVATTPAETMNVPSAHASIRYSGQCAESESRAVTISPPSRIRGTASSRRPRTS